jgi:hypothetical protein
MRQLGLLRRFRPWLRVHTDGHAVHCRERLRKPWSPQADGTVVTIVAGASGCPNPLYEFWILPPGGSWTIMQSYSSTATFTWYTISPAGTYYYSVWSRDVSSSASYDAYFPGTAYTLT